MVDVGSVGRKDLSAERFTEPTSTESIYSLKAWRVMVTHINGLNKHGKIAYSSRFQLVKE